MDLKMKHHKIVSYSKVEFKINLFINKYVYRDKSRIKYIFTN